MDNMLIVALMVVSCILINPFVSASEVKKVAVSTEQTQSDDQETSDEDSETEDEESSN